MGIRMSSANSRLGDLEYTNLGCLVLYSSTLRIQIQNHKPPSSKFQVPTQQQFHMLNDRTDIGRAGKSPFSFSFSFSFTFTFTFTFTHTPTPSTPHHITSHQHPKPHGKTAHGKPESDAVCSGRGRSRTKSSFPGSLWASPTQTHPYLDGMDRMVRYWYSVSLHLRSELRVGIQESVFKSRCSRVYATTLLYVISGI
ncbi:hypothetical protein EAF00_002698 [Botryotinia globosa]|nr:hypothetical protein EAF00_002698 [Botryotinia globosa]